MQHNVIVPKETGLYVSIWAPLRSLFQWTSYYGYVMGPLSCDKYYFLYKVQFL